jgi:phosphoserine phosphatase
VPRPFRSFWFDCDSTLSAIEGVDELTRVLPERIQREIKALTEAAMDGTLPLADVYEKRLAVIAPTRAMLDEVGRLYVEKLVPGAREVVAALQFLGKRVGIVSGGLLPVVLVLARELGVAPEDVHAVDVRFDRDGRYVEFSRASPLWRNGGKRELFASFGDGPRPICFVGDGATDLEAKDAVELFVGFGGVAEREVVRRGAGAFVMRLADVLGVALTETEASRLASVPRFAHLADTR